jgi:hypothetical protein
MSDLYNTDILLWSERQAKLLRRHAAGEHVNDAAIDHPTGSAPTSPSAA